MSGDHGIGLIGLGARLADVLKHTLPRVAKARVVVICDPDQARVEARARTLKFDHAAFYEHAAVVRPR